MTDPAQHSLTHEHSNIPANIIFAARATLCTAYPRTYPQAVDRSFRDLAGSVAGNYPCERYLP